MCYREIKPNAFAAEYLAYLRQTSSFRFATQKHIILNWRFPSVPPVILWNSNPSSVKINIYYFPPIIDIGLCSWEGGVEESEKKKP